jgi:hypothetical protein
MKLICYIPYLSITDLIVRSSPHIETEVGDFASINFISGLKPRSVGATDMVLKDEIGVRLFSVAILRKGVFIKYDATPVVPQVGAQISSTAPLAFGCLLESDLFCFIVTNTCPIGFLG